MPDLDDIPDIEEDELEEGDDEATAVLRCRLDQLLLGWLMLGMLLLGCWKSRRALMISF